MGIQSSNQGQTRNHQHVDTLELGISRRDFFRLGAAASFGLAAGTLSIPRIASATPAATSRVVVVTDEQVVDGSTIQLDIVRTMIDAGIQALTDAPTPSEAWRVLIPDLAADLSIGIKLNCASRFLPSHPEVAGAIAESLTAVSLPMGTYPINELLFWERTDYELSAAGYTINTSTTGPRCFGTNHQGIGFDPNSVDINGSTQYISRCYTQYSDRIINLSCLKNHGIAGVTLSLKNHYGTVHNAQALHSTYCNPSIPALNAVLRSTYGAREKLCICDAIFGIYVGGPTGYPQFTFKGLVISQDPVAVDAVCRQILDENGCTTTWFADHIDTAAESPYDLGNSSFDNIDRIDVINPSGGASSGRKSTQPEEIALGNPYPEPFNSVVTIPINLDRSANFRLQIHDLRGHRIRIIHQGALSSGKHNLSWNGRDENGKAVPAGSYVVRLVTSERKHSRLVTLIR